MESRDSTLDAKHPGRARGNTASLVFHCSGGKGVTVPLFNGGGVLSVTRYGQNSLKTSAIYRYKRRKFSQQH